MTVQDSIKQFYDTEAKKYAQTREKHRSEADIFLDMVQQSDKKNIKILEVGCGSGRLLSYLITLDKKNIDYTGIDLSPELLKIAKKQIKPSQKHITCTFVCGDMTQEIKRYKQESFDYVFSIASFQHIPTQKERYYLMKSFYRLLRYDGVLAMTNRSFSTWFVNKYQNVIIKSILRWALSRGKKMWNDLLIPWYAQRRTFQRFYHIFTRRELKTLTILSGFTIHQISYLDSKGKETLRRQESRSTLLVGQKKVFVQ